jgi:hypothetical protein
MAAVLKILAKDPAVIVASDKRVITAAEIDAVIASDDDVGRHRRSAEKHARRSRPAGVGDCRSVRHAQRRPAGGDRPGRAALG